MIDAARALREQAQAKLDYIAEEAERLQAMIEALDAFIEQPAAPSAGEGVPVAPGPEASSARASASGIQQPAARQGAPGPSFPSVSRPAAVSSPPGGGPPATCPECGFVAKSRLGLGVHRQKQHRVAGSSATHPSRSEKFLCSRNCGASFPSHQGVREHESENTCSPKQTRPPSGPTALGRLSGATRADGFGQ